MQGLEIFSSLQTLHCRKLLFGTVLDFILSIYSPVKIG